MIVVNTPIGELYEDPNNPRQADTARLAVLALSIQKLGFCMPLFATKEGMVLSGHQRLSVARSLGIDKVPVITVDIPEKRIQGVNVLFNRATNDFTAFDTGAKSALSLEKVIDSAEELPFFEGDNWFANDCKLMEITALARKYVSRYEQKPVVLAASLRSMGVQIPAVISESGEVVNGLYRLLDALRNKIVEWPVIVVPDAVAKVTGNMLNYLSMDFHVNDDFARLLRYSAYRRFQNNRGHVPKAYRFWASGERTLLDRDTYSPEFWQKFRDIHGDSLLDFGAGLCKVKPFLEKRGFSCEEFEPYRIDPAGETKKPDAAFSIAKAREFLDIVESGVRFDSIFLASVLNSVPFPKDRMVVLAVVHALCDKNTVVYGTCRDISDFNYEYGGIRNANYFVFGTETGVRIGDVVNAPKIQKFHTQDEARAMLSRLWATIEFWPGGNVFYWRAADPKNLNPKVLAQALDHEFDLPYGPSTLYPEGTTMGLAEYARRAFGKRLSLPL